MADLKLTRFEVSDMNASRVIHSTTPESAARALIPQFRVNLELDRQEGDKRVYSVYDWSGIHVNSVIVVESPYEQGE